MLKNLIKDNMGNYSINKLSQEIGLTYANTHSIVNAECLDNYKISTLQKIAEVLEVEITDLYLSIRFVISVDLLDSRGYLLEDNNHDVDVVYNRNEIEPVIEKDFGYTTYRKGLAQVQYVVYPEVYIEDRWELIDDTEYKGIFEVDTFIKSIE